MVDGRTTKEQLVDVLRWLIDYADTTRGQFLLSCAAVAGILWLVLRLTTKKPRRRRRRD